MYSNKKKVLYSDYIENLVEYNKTIPNRWTQYSVNGHNHIDIIKKM